MTKKNTKQSGEKLNVLMAIPTEELNTCENKKWEAVEFTIDNGANENVCSTDLLKNVNTLPGESHRRGIHYEMARGQLVPNEGEKNLHNKTREGISKRITTQIDAVNRALLNVDRIIAMNHAVHFQNDNYIEDLKRQKSPHRSQQERDVHGKNASNKTESSFVRHGRGL